MTLQDKLDSLREASKARIPPETRADMERSTEELRASGIMRRPEPARTIEILRGLRP